MSRISELSATIAAATTGLDAYNATHGLSSPSFDASYPATQLLDPNIANLRQSILNATDELHSLLLGPAALLTPAHNEPISLQGIVRFGIYDCIPQDQFEVSVADIARSSVLSENLVLRLMRHAAARHIFKESRRGVFEHTAASKMLAADPLMRQWIGMVTEEMWPAATRTVDAIAKWPNSADPTQSGYNLAHQTKANIFEHLAATSWRQQRYTDAMSWFNTGPGLETAHITGWAEWAALPDGAVVVDVGGASGSVSIALAQCFPHLRCIVQDQREIVTAARLKAPADLTGSKQLAFQEHDFFQPQPLRGVSVFYLRWVLHDWSDEVASNILRGLVPAMTSDTRVVLSEYIVPQPGDVPPYEAKMFGRFDLSMLELHNGKERDLDEWKALFAKADRRFVLLRATQPPRSRLSMIEVGWNALGAGLRADNMGRQSCSRVWPYRGRAQSCL